MSMDDIEKKLIALQGKYELMELMRDKDLEEIKRYQKTTSDYWEKTWSTHNRDLREFIDGLKDEIKLLNLNINKRLDGFDKRFNNYVSKEDFDEVKNKLDKLEVLLFFIKYRKVTALVLIGLYAMAYSDVRGFISKLIF